MSLNAPQGGAHTIAPYFSEGEDLSIKPSVDGSSVSIQGILAFDEMRIDRDWLDMQIPEATLSGKPVSISLEGLSESTVGFSTELPIDIFTGSDELILLFVHPDGEEEKVSIPIEFDPGELAPSLSVTGVEPSTIVIESPDQPVELTLLGSGFTEENVAGLKVTVRGWDPEKKEMAVEASPPEFVSDTESRVMLGGGISRCVRYELSVNDGGNENWSFGGDVDISSLSDGGGSGGGGGGTVGASPRVAAIGTPKKSFAQKLGGFAKGVALTIPVVVEGEGFSGDPLKDGSLKLLAHELTHVVQQGSGSISNLQVSSGSISFDVVAMLSDDDRSFSPDGEGMIELELYGETYEVPYSVTYEWPAPIWGDGDCDDADDSLRLLADGSIAPGSEVMSLSGTIEGDYFPPDLASRLACTCSPGWGSASVVSFSASSSGPVIHWTLEIRVDRIEMKRLMGGGSGGGGGGSVELPLEFSFDGAVVSSASCPITVEIEEPSAPRLQFRPLGVDGALVVEMDGAAVSFDSTDITVSVSVSGEVTEDMEVSSASFSLGGKGVPPELSKLSFTCEPSELKSEKGQFSFEVSCAIGDTSGVFDPSKWSTLKALTGNLVFMVGGMEGSVPVSVPLQIDLSPQAPLVKLIVPVAMDKGLRFRSFVLPHVLETSGSMSFTLEGENFTEDMTVESLSISSGGEDQDCDGYDLVVTSSTTATLTCPLSPQIFEGMVAASDMTRLTVPTSSSMSMSATCVVGGESVSCSFDVPVSVEVPEATFTASRATLGDVSFDEGSSSATLPIEWSLDGTALFPELMTKTTFAILLDDGSSISVDFDPASAEFADDGSSLSFTSVVTVPIKKEEGGRHTPFHNKLMASSGSSSVEQDLSYELEMPILPPQLHSVEVVSVSPLDLDSSEQEFSIVLRVGVLNPTEEFIESLILSSLSVEDLSIDEREMTTGADWDYRSYQPGQPVFGNITFTCSPGSSGKLIKELEYARIKGGDSLSMSSLALTLSSSLDSSQSSSASSSVELLMAAPESVIESFTVLAVSPLDSPDGDVTVSLGVTGQNLDLLRRENDTWSADAFTCVIDGMPEARVSKVDAFTIKQGMTTEGELVLTLSGLAFADGHVYDKSTPKLATRVVHSSGVSFDTEIPLSAELVASFGKATPKLSEIVVTKVADSDGDGYSDLLVSVSGEDCDDLSEDDIEFACAIGDYQVSASWTVTSTRSSGFDLSVFGFTPEEIKSAARTAGGSSSSPSGDFELVCTVSIAPTVMGSSPGKPLSKTIVIPHILESNPKITAMSVASVTPLDDGESSDVTIVFDVEGEDLDAYTGSTQKTWLPANFRIRINELEARLSSLGMLTLTNGSSTSGQFTMVVTVPVDQLRVVKGEHIKHVKLECRFVDDSSGEVTAESDLLLSDALSSRLSGGEGSGELFDDTEGRENMISSFSLSSISLDGGELVAELSLEYSDAALQNKAASDWHECFLIGYAVLPGGGSLSASLEGEQIASFPPSITLTCPDTAACLEQMRAAGWSPDQDCDITVSLEQFVAPRDSASGQATGRRERGSGLATGRRTYEPIVFKKRIDKSSPLLMRISPVSSETGDLDGDGVPEIVSLSCVVEGENLDGLSSEDLVVSVDFGDGPVEVNLQGFVVNAHTSAFDLSVFGFDPVPIASSSMRKSSSEGGPYLTVTLKEVMVSGISAPGGGSGGGGGGSLTGSISVPDYLDPDDDGDGVPTIDEDLRVSASPPLVSGGRCEIKIELGWETADPGDYNCDLKFASGTVLSGSFSIDESSASGGSTVVVVSGSLLVDDVSSLGVQTAVLSVSSPRDSASGQATGKRAPRDSASGQATGRRTFKPASIDIDFGDSSADQQKVSAITIRFPKGYATGPIDEDGTFDLTVEVSAGKARPKQKAWLVSNFKVEVGSASSRVVSVEETGFDESSGFAQLTLSCIVEAADLPKTRMNDKASPTLARVVYSEDGQESSAEVEIGMIEVPETERGITISTSHVEYSSARLDSSAPLVDGAPPVIISSLTIDLEENSGLPLEAPLSYSLQFSDGSVYQGEVEYSSGDPQARKRPGKVKYGDITLKRGMMSESPGGLSIIAILIGLLADGSTVSSEVEISLDSEVSSVWKEFSPAEDQLKGNPRHRPGSGDGGEGSDTGTPGEQIGGGKVSVSDLNLMFTGGKLSARASFVLDGTRSQDDGDITAQAVLPGGGVLGGTCTVDPATGEAMCVLDQNLSEGGADPLVLLVSSGWTGPQVSITFSVSSPRDAASGQATGKRAPGEPQSGLSTGRRQYEPVTFPTDLSIPIVYSSVSYGDPVVSVQDDGSFSMSCPFTLSGEFVHLAPPACVAVDPVSGAEIACVVEISSSSSSSVSGRFSFSSGPRQSTSTDGTRKFNGFEAWPCRWKAPELNSSSDTYIVEELEFAVEKVERARTAGGSGGGEGEGEEPDESPAEGIDYNSSRSNKTSLDQPDDVADGEMLISSFDIRSISGEGGELTATAPIVWSSITGLQDKDYLSRCSVDFSLVLNEVVTLSASLSGDALAALPSEITLTCPDSSSAVSQLMASGWKGQDDDCDGVFSVTQEVTAPRDSASGQATGRREPGSGLATGRRQYQPLLIRKRIDKSSPLLARVGDDDSDGQSEEEVTFSVDSSAVSINRRVCTCPLGWKGRLAPGAHDVTLTLGGVVFSGSFTLEQESSEGEVVLSLEAPESADLSSLGGTLEAELSVSSPRDSASGQATGKVSRSGDTMTGDLVLNADPAAVKSPRDSASGQATGKRTHKPLSFSIVLDSSSSSSATGDPTEDQSDTVEGEVQAVSLNFTKIEWVAISENSGDLYLEFELEGSPEQLSMLQGATPELRVAEVKREIETLEWTSGMDGRSRKALGRMKCSDVTLERALIDSGTVEGEAVLLLPELDEATMASARKDMLQWYSETAKGKNIRKNITINLRTHQSEKGSASRSSETGDGPITSASISSMGTENGAAYMDVALIWSPRSNLTTDFVDGRYVLRAGVPLRSMSFSTEFDVEGGSPPSTVRLFEESPQGEGSLEQLRSSMGGQDMDIELNYEVSSPRDAASGQATGKRTHKPLRMRMYYDSTASSSDATAGTRAQDHNSSRSNKTASDELSPDGGSSSDAPVQDHNSSRSNKTSSVIAPPDGGDGRSPEGDISFTFGKIMWTMNADGSASLEVDVEFEGSPELLAAMQGASLELSSTAFEGSAVEVIEYKDGDDPLTHKRAGKAKYKNIILKRGYANDPSLFVSGVVVPVVPAAARGESDGTKKIRDWVKDSLDSRSISSSFSLDSTGGEGGDMKLSSGQPVIVENEKGLLVMFRGNSISSKALEEFTAELDFSSAPEAARKGSGHRIVFDDRDGLYQVTSIDDAFELINSNPLYEESFLQTNPLFQQQGMQGENPLFEGGSTALREQLSQSGGTIVFNPMSATDKLYLCPLLSSDGSETAIGISLSPSPVFDGYAVLFNPREYTVTKSTPWKHHDIQGLDAPTQELVGGVLPGGAVISAAVSCRVAGGGDSSVIVDFSLDGMQDIVYAGRSAGGAGGGFYFIPEVSDEVAISFDGDNTPIIKGSALGSGQRSSGPGGGGGGGTVIVLGSLWNGQDRPSNAIALSEKPRMSVNLTVERQQRFSVSPIITSSGQLLLEFSGLDGPTGNGGTLCGETEHFFTDSGDQHEQEADAVADRLGPANGGVERPETHVHGDPHVDLHVVTGEDGLNETDEDFFALMVSFTSSLPALTLADLPALEAVLLQDGEEVGSVELKPSLSPDGGGWYSAALDLSVIEEGASFDVELRLLEGSATLDGKELEGDSIPAVSNVLKTRHETAKNSIGNIR